MVIRGKLLVTALTMATFSLAGCTTVSPPTEVPSASTAGTVLVVPGTITVAPAEVAATPALATPAAPQVDPVTFFRAQEAVCARHAAATGNPAVDPARFAGAKQVRDLGDGATSCRTARARGSWSSRRRASCGRRPGGPGT